MHIGLKSRKAIGPDAQELVVEAGQIELDEAERRDDIRERGACVYVGHSIVYQRHHCVGETELQQMDTQGGRRREGKTEGAGRGKRVKTTSGARPRRGHKQATQSRSTAATDT